MRLHLRLFDHVFEFVEPAAAGGFLRLSIHLEIVILSRLQKLCLLGRFLALGDPMGDGGEQAHHDIKKGARIQFRQQERKLLLVGNETCQLGQQVVLALGGAGRWPA